MYACRILLCGWGWLADTARLASTTRKRHANGRQSMQYSIVAHQSSIEHARAIVHELFGAAAARAFDVAYWDGSTERGTRASPFALRIARPAALRRMLLPPSEVSIVEAFLSGDVDVDGNLEAAVTLGDAINSRLKSPRVLARL